jgi:metal-responsive CopG/Arc/MetJ family transcriptional regulator
MPATKFAISVPAETMREVDRAAKRLRMSRSRYISTILARVAKRTRDASISKRVDEVLAEIGVQDLEPVEQLQSARRDEGTEWCQCA